MASSVFKFVLVISLAVLVLYLVSSYYGNLGCPDGTPSNSCSGTVPLFCSGGELVEKASLCGCEEGYEVRGESCAEVRYCPDGTLIGECSLEKPYFCLGGELIKNVSLCGCDRGYDVIGEDCIERPRCSDGTYYGECSGNKPLFCHAGELYNRSSLCGCPMDYLVVGDACVSKFDVGPEERALTYVLRGKKANIIYKVYPSLNEYLENKSRTYVCDPECPTEQDLLLLYLDEEEQDKKLKTLVQEIKNLSYNRDDRLRIAVSIVQEIPYDTEGLETGDLTNRYPYEVLYDQKGICEEKARLLAYLLRGLGYSVSLLNYDVENHSAVGVECSWDYSQYVKGNTSYCFIETTTPSIATDNTGYYPGAGKLESLPVVLKVSDGNLFESVSEEYEDARTLIQLTEKAESNGRKLPGEEYDLWEDLVEKYDLKTTNRTG